MQRRWAAIVLGSVVLFFAAPTLNQFFASNDDDSDVVLTEFIGPAASGVTHAQRAMSAGALGAPVLCIVTIVVCALLVLAYTEPLWQSLVLATSRAPPARRVRTYKLY